MRSHGHCYQYSRTYFVFMCVGVVIYIGIRVMNTCVTTYLLVYHFLPFIWNALMSLTFKHFLLFFVDSFDNAKKLKCKKIINLKVLVTDTKAYETWTY